MTKRADISLNDLYPLCSTRLSNIFSKYLQEMSSLELKTAMTYTLANGGKHLRPLLIYATGFIFNAPLENLDIPASAVELIHTYSLIHDDLPCMDNADLRRGQPSCHKVYGEGLAVLTGDALHTLAMQILASHPAKLPSERRLRMIDILSNACGPFGMAGGQALDITIMQDETISADLLMDIYQLKTGALFRACLELGRLASTDDNDINRNALSYFGESIGTAFQIQDDILDIEGNSQQTGKTAGLDGQNKKITYPKLFGLRKAKEKVQFLYQDALAAINYLGDKAQLLREVTTVMLHQD